MRKCYLILPLIVLMSGCVTRPSKPEKPLTVAEVVSEIDKAVAEVREKTPAGLPPFDSAEVELETSVSQETDGTFKLFVVSFGSKVSKATTQTIAFKLTPPPPPKKPLAEQAQPMNEILAKAIVAASAEISAALSNPTNNSNGILLHDLSATIKFEVSRSANGGIEFDVGSVTLGGSHTRTAGFSHSVTLNYVTSDDEQKIDEKKACDEQRECMKPMLDKLMTTPPPK